MENAYGDNSTHAVREREHHGKRAAAAAGPPLGAFFSARVIACAASGANGRASAKLMSIMENISKNRITWGSTRTTTRFRDEPLCLEMLFCAGCALSTAKHSTQWRRRQQAVPNNLPGKLSKSTWVTHILDNDVIKDYGEEAEVLEWQQAVDQPPPIEHGKNTANDVLLGREPVKEELGDAEQRAGNTQEVAKVSDEGAGQADGA